jgi:DNA-binding transcriptional LysR family regulator
VQTPDLQVLIPYRPEERRLVQHIDFLLLKPSANFTVLRLPTYGGLFAWEFEKNGHELKVRVEGQLVFNNIALRLNAALAGFGLTYLPEDMVKPHLAKRQLVRVLADWCPPFSGYHLYYPSRRQHTPAFTLLVDALRYRG